MLLTGGVLRKKLVTVRGASALVPGVEIYAVTTSINIKGYLFVALRSRLGNPLQFKRCIRQFAPRQMKVWGIYHLLDKSDSITSTSIN